MLVKFDSAGQLHVLDTGAGTIYKVEDGQNISVAELSPGLDNFVIDEQGRFFVTSFADGFVKRVNTDKSVTRTAAWWHGSCWRGSLFSG